MVVQLPDNPAPITNALVISKSSPPANITYVDPKKDQTVVKLKYWGIFEEAIPEDWEIESPLEDSPVLKGYNGDDNYFPHIFQWMSPSMRTGVTKSGMKWEFGKFIPSKYAKTEKDAFAWIFENKFDKQLVVDIEEQSYIIN